MPTLFPPVALSVVVNSGMCGTFGRIRRFLTTLSHGLPGDQPLSGIPASL